MRVLSVASECAPLVKTGGLADVVGALPAALKGQGIDMRVLLPAYQGIRERLGDAVRVPMPSLGGDAALLCGRAVGMDIVLLDIPSLFDRGGAPYGDAEGRDWADNHLRFAALARAGAQIAISGVDGWMPDLLHAHDWQAGLVPLYLRQSRPTGAKTTVLMTIHNIAFQGLFPMGVAADLGIGDEMLTQDGAEFWGQLGFLKAGLAMADRLSTVSPTYARELLTPQFGMGLQGLLQHRSGDLCGILNGIDTGVWNPGNGEFPNAATPEGKAANRAALAARFGLDPAPDAPLFVVVSRMTGQKGLDQLLEALPDLLSQGASLAILGSGERALEAAFEEAAGRNPGRIGFVRGYDEALSRLIFAGGDAVLVPSRFEPCGLTQLIGLRYGTLPVVSRTGGLADTVIDANDAALRGGVATGFVHDPGSTPALVHAIARCCDVFRAPGLWATMRTNALRQPVGWDRSAAAYATLYRSMIEDE